MQPALALGGLLPKTTKAPQLAAEVAAWTARVGIPARAFMASLTAPASPPPADDTDTMTDTEIETGS